MKLVYIATDPLTVFRLMEGQLAYMRTRGFDVTVISAPGSLLQKAAAREGVRAVAVPMRREPAPLRDIISLIRLAFVLRSIRPTLVNAGTPKAGLLGVVAARAVGVPRVVYHLRGLRFEGTRGAKRLALAAAEHVAGGLSHRIFANSRSVRDRFVSLGCATTRKTFIPGSGSSNGVDVARFSPTPSLKSWARLERARLNIPEDAVVVGFVGRFARDKGICELASAFRTAVAAEPRLRLLLVGENDDTDPLDVEVRDFIAQDPRVVTTGFVDEPARLYSLMNILAFPSVREGFPNVPLEAAASGLPVVAFRATGTVDAVVDGETGRLVPIGDVPALAAAIIGYARDPVLATEHGRRGMRRVANEFQRERVWEELAEEYTRLTTAP